MSVKKRDRLLSGPGAILLMAVILGSELTKILLIIKQALLKG